MIPPELEKQFREECCNEPGKVRLEGWCTPEKAVVLAELILARKPGLIVESGIFGGRSLLMMSLAARLNGNGICVGIDPWTVEAALEGGIGKDQEEWWTKNMKLEEIYAGFVRAVVRLELTKECRWIRAKSEVAACMFNNGSINLFHQDSNHSELVSCKEVETWHKKIAAGGLWIMDDADWTTQAKALRQIEELGFKRIRDERTFMVFERK